MEKVEGYNSIGDMTLLHVPELSDKHKAFSFSLICWAYFYFIYQESLAFYAQLLSMLKLKHAWLALYGLCHITVCIIIPFMSHWGTGGIRKPEREVMWGSARLQVSSQTELQHVEASTHEESVGNVNDRIKSRVISPYNMHGYKKYQV